MTIISAGSSRACSDAPAQTAGGGGGGGKDALARLVLVCRRWLCETMGPRLASVRGFNWEGNGIACVAAAEVAEEDALDLFCG